MRKIAISLFVIALVGAATIGATRAYFTDQAVVDDNTFGTGILDFTLNGDMTETQSLDLPGMVPGEWYGPYSMKVYNKSTSMPIKYRFMAEKESQTVPGLYGKLNARVTHGYCVSGGISPITHDETTTMAGMLFESPTDAISATLNTNITHCFELYFQLDESAGNEFQGGSAVVDIVVDGTQPSNPGWTE